MRTWSAALSLAFVVSGCGSDEPSRGNPGVGTSGCDGCAGTVSADACTGCAGAAPESGAPGGGTGGSGSTPGSAPTTSVPSEWFDYNFDASNSQFNPNETRLTAGNVAGLKEKWRIDVERAATSRPAVAEDTVYFGAWDGALYAADALNGAIRWRTPLGLSFIRSSPVVVGDTVYVGADGWLHARNRSDGSERWRTELDPHPQVMLDSSPVLADDVIVIGVASYELGLDKPDYTFEGSVVGLDAASGAELWRVPVTGSGTGLCVGGGGVSVWSSAAIDAERGLAFIGTGQTYESPASTCNDSLLAIHYRRDHAGERVAWVATFTGNDIFTSIANGPGPDQDIGASPNLFEGAGQPLVGVGDKGGTYRAFHRDTGEEVWRAALPAGGGALGGVMATAALYDGTLFIAQNHWTRYAFSRDGSHSPGDTSTLHAIDVNDGSQKWQVALSAPVFGSFAVAGGVLYHPIISGTLYARDPATGAELWRASLGKSLGVGPAVASGRVFQSSGFLIHGPAAGGAVVAYGLDGDESGSIDGGGASLPPLDEAACLAAIDDRLSPGCQSCLCVCDPTATGYCSPTCWERASCTLQYCASEDFSTAAGRACMEANCTVKLLPPDVFEGSVATAPCVQACAASCSFP